ncbi:hypothetical protein WMY93_007490 [Mugilogobius chulae]|uniref:G-protein coupled receptors family 1 profile domain-containing protein n=1 Tax=Mugilogobius chulae TaxID=88201 RepID=A0AAW0PGU3_9GOBI
MRRWLGLRGDVTSIAASFQEQRAAQTLIGDWRKVAQSPGPGAHVDLLHHGLWGSLEKDPHNRSTSAGFAGPDGNHHVRAEAGDNALTWTRASGCRLLLHTSLCRPPLAMLTSITFNIYTQRRVREVPQTTQALSQDSPGEGRSYWTGALGGKLHRHGKNMQTLHPSLYAELVLGPGAGGVPVGGFLVAPGYRPLLFLLLLCNFLLALAGNGSVLVAVATDRRLRRPMFVLIVNLALVDLLGASAVCPRLLMHFLYADRPISYRSISHAHALLQAFAVHTYGVAAQTVLAAMAYDRFVAVCEPLRYHSIMTPVRLIWLCFWSWFSALVLIGILFGLHAGPGQAITYLVNCGVFLITAFSYVQILLAVLGRGGLDPVQSRSKALQTCLPHLVVYVLYNVAVLILVASYRFPALSANLRKLVSILFIIIPPTINPIIYGLVSAELRRAVGRQLRRVVPKNKR